MKVCNVLNCSFPEWYCNFKGITTESIIIPLPDTFLNYLHTDGVVLPESSKHGLYTKTKKMAMDGDEDDEDIRDDELMKKYEADWATDYSSKTAMSPDFGEFDTKVKSAIKSLGGKVFPKLNWSSPKDAHWIAFDKSLMCTCPSDVYLLLKSSQFIAHDLDQPFLMCEDYTPNTHELSLNFCLILRKWEPPDPSNEFRCFVHENKLIGVCQRNANKFYPHILNDKKSIVEDISTFLNQSLTVFPDSNYVFDIAYNKKGCIYLIDFNPYGVVTDALMFTWDELNQMADNKRESPVFRCVESEAGVQCLDYANYSIPQDIQHLTTGEDSYKLMDLMKLQIQKEFDSSSSSD